MGVRSQASSNPVLTNFAQGIAQDVMSRLAEFLAPTVDTGGAILGGYKKYDEKNAFQALEYARAIGGGFKRIDFGMTDGTFNCLPVGLEIPLDDSEVSEGTDRTRLEQAKVKTLITTAHLSREKKVIDKILATVAALADFGVWSDPDVDPVAELDAVIEAIATDLGVLPNRIALGLGAWKVIKNHKKVLARQPGSQNQGVTLQQFAGMLLNPAVEIRTGILSRDTTKFGKDKSAVNIMGAKLLVYYAESSPTQYDASFAKTFSTALGNVDSVETYREEGVTSDIHRVRWSEDIQVPTTVAGRRIDLS
jgi:hypothetical protein